jgi:hypothetical protein
MSLPGPGTFSSLSAETPCYTYNWQNNIASDRNIPYTDCNGTTGLTQFAPAGQSGNFCARSRGSVPGGGVTVTQAGDCPCKTWWTRVFNSANGRTYTFSWLDCNGQYAQKTIRIADTGPTTASFFSCSNSAPNLISQSGPGDIANEIAQNNCNRTNVG